jgi:hypothetical protein
MRISELLNESKTDKTAPSKPRNFVAKNAKGGGAGAHKDKSKTIPRKEKHKKSMPVCEHCGEHHDLKLDEHGKASKQLCQSSKPDSELGASNLASCKSQGLRARDGEKSHKLGKSPKSRIKVGGHRIKGKKYGGPLPDWS